MFSVESLLPVLQHEGKLCNGVVCEYGKEGNRSRGGGAGK
jgi:hypothetical protein